jgi:hypothetical protein
MCSRSRSAPAHLARKPDKRAFLPSPYRQKRAARCARSKMRAPTFCAYPKDRELQTQWLRAAELLLGELGAASFGKQVELRPFLLR